MCSIETEKSGEDRTNKKRELAETEAEWKAVKERDKRKKKEK